MVDVFFLWRCKNNDFELFVWLRNGKENKVQFTLEMENENCLPFLDIGTKSEGKLMNWNSNHPKNMLLGVLNV